MTNGLSWLKYFEVNNFSLRLKINCFWKEVEHRPQLQQELKS